MWRRERRGVRQPGRTFTEGLRDHLHEVGLVRAFLGGVRREHGATLGDIVEIQERDDLYVDVDGDQLAPVQTGLAGRDQAISLANQVCGMMAALNARCEGLHLVEDILLRDADSDFDPLSLHVVLPGWTTRTAAPDFRKFAEETLNLVCPAHLRRRMIWLSYAESRTFETLWSDWRSAYQAAKNPLVEAGESDALVDASRKLRAFLNKERKA